MSGWRFFPCQVGTPQGGLGGRGVELFDPGQGLRKIFGPGGKSARPFCRGEVLEKSLEAALESQVERTLEAAQVEMQVQVETVQVVRAVRFLGEGRPWHSSVLKEGDNY